MEEEKEMAIIEQESLAELRNKGIDTIPRLFQYRTKIWKDHVAMRDKVLGVWKEFTWGDYGEQVEQVALGLLELGMKKEDTAAILSENCPEWLFCDEGILAAGGVTVGVYATDSASQIEYIANNCGARFFFVEDEEQLDKILEVREKTPAVEKIIVYDMKGLRDFDDPMVMSFDDLLELGEKSRSN